MSISSQQYIVKEPNQIFLTDTMVPKFRHIWSASSYMHHWDLNINVLSDSFLNIVRHIEDQWNLRTNIKYNPWQVHWVSNKCAPTVLQYSNPLGNGTNKCIFIALIFVKMNTNNTINSQWIELGSKTSYTINTQAM